MGPARLTLQGRRAGECREPISNTPPDTMPFCNPTFSKLISHWATVRRAGWGRSAVKKTGRSDTSSALLEACFKAAERLWPRPSLARTRALLEQRAGAEAAEREQCSRLRAPAARARRQSAEHRGLRSARPAAAAKAAAPSMWLQNRALESDPGPSHLMKSPPYSCPLSQPEISSAKPLSPPPA